MKSFGDGELSDTRKAVKQKNRGCIALKALRYLLLLPNGANPNWKRCKSLASQDRIPGRILWHNARDSVKGRSQAWQSGSQRLKRAVPEGGAGSSRLPTQPNFGTLLTYKPPLIAQGLTTVRIICDNQVSSFSNFYDVFKGQLDANITSLCYLKTIIGRRVLYTI